MDVQSGVGAAALSLETLSSCFISCVPFLLEHACSDGAKNLTYKHFQHRRRLHRSTSRSPTLGQCHDLSIPPCANNVAPKLSITLRPRGVVKIKAAGPNSGDAPAKRGTRTGWGGCRSELHTARKGHQEGENCEHGIEGHTKQQVFPGTSKVRE